ncbi:LuxR family transcriptional regulator [Planotetraspora silvatica]|uniref:LuxR family transcriptional regulator n=1 Tax=Planotetraspora silvatica TaxID=234614 RepID=A0A8J3URC2_9ACTN|nr:AAA family ATPase [Planotetraspora silvatica]GII50668.1 LuxR family transcriptional regulator [Planotetraspora silvatica]
MREVEGGLVGRAPEIESIRALLADVTDHGATIVVCGEAGVGKTALADAAVDYARWRGIDVLRAYGVEAEKDVPWATLHQLVHALRDRVADLPAPQRNALQVAFGESEGPQPSLFLTGLATLTLLSERATAAGLLVVIEDLHWADHATRAAIGFLVRRISSEPIVMLITSRSDEAADQLDATLEQHRLTLDPLSDTASRQLLDGQDPPLSPAARDLVLREALGNPLALIELSVAVRRGDWPLPGPLPLTKRLENAFAHRLTPLTAAERAVILTAAVGANGRQPDLVAAASRLHGDEVGSTAVDGLVRAGLLKQTAGEFRFRHPLVRSAVIQTATPDERTRAHLAVAELLPPGTDRRLWHLAVAAERPDDELAQALEHSATRAHSAGDMTTAMEAFRRAAELSPELEDRAYRNYLGAEAALAAGQVTEGKQLADQVSRQTTDRALLARVAWLLELFPGGAMQRGDLHTAITIADELHTSGNSDQAINILTTMSLHLWGSMPEGPIWSTMIERAEAYGADPADPRLLCLKAFGTPEENSQHVRKIVNGIDPSLIDDSEHLRLLGLALTNVGELERVESFLQPAMNGLRRDGRLSILALTMQSSAFDLYRHGRFRQMLDLSDESQRLAEEANEPFVAMAAHFCMLTAQAVLGEDIDLSSIRDAFPAAAIALDHNPFLVIEALTQGIADASHGRHQAAFEQLKRATDPTSPIYHWGWSLKEAFPWFIDAAVRSGHRDDALGALQRLEALPGLTATPLHRGYLVLARALLADGDDADDAYASATAPTHNPLPFWRARAQLANGERLRRQRRIKEARHELRQARDEFDRMHSRPWADLARAELSATGESSPRRKPDPGATLTPQEERIATLVVEGLTNREIAQRLFLSPRTVGAHLYATYRKLQVSSRAELGPALGLPS